MVIDTMDREAGTFQSQADLTTEHYSKGPHAPGQRRLDRGGPIPIQGQQSGRDVSDRERKAPIDQDEEGAWRRVG